MSYRDLEVLRGFLRSDVFADNVENEFGAVFRIHF